MKFENIVPKRRLTVSITIVTLIAIFFIGYYFYYIPTNKEDLSKNGFLILENIKKSIADRDEDYKKLYKAFFDKGRSENSEATKIHVQKLLDSNNVNGDVFSVTDTLFLKDEDGLFNSLDIANKKSKLQGTVVKQTNFIYLDSNYNHSLLGILVPAEYLLQSVFQSQSEEVFESYFLIDKKNGIVYKDAGVAITSNIRLDSLLPGSSAMQASITDIRIKDVRYKMFSYPFIFGNDNIVLCGLIEAKKYNARLHEIPITFIYPIVVIFLLLLIFLPIIKFYLIGTNESLKFADAALSALSFIAGPTLITLILIQVLLLWSADMRAKGNLEKLSAQIDSGFRKDITGAFSQLDALDNFLSGMKNVGGHKQNVSDSIINYFRSHKNDPTLFYNFDRVVWVDSSGEQQIKGQLENADPLFTNVSTRKYFELFRNNKAYMLPGNADQLFAFEPVNSWTNNEFSIVISKRSKLRNQFIVGLATQMPSVLNTILPPGFGFCIINENGDVQLHSDMRRNLRENIIEKMSPSRQVKEAVSSRQTGNFNNLRFYGNTNVTHISPIANIPFFLVTFYDKGYIVPVAMRIFTFALLFCFVSFFISLVIWSLVFGKSYYKNPMLYSPMVFLKWAVPRSHSRDFYILTVRFLIAYVLVLLLFMALSASLGITNYVVLVLVLVIPVNVLSGVFVISYSTTKHKSTVTEKISSRSKKALRAIAFQAISTALVYIYSLYSEFPIQWPFLAFQGIFNAALWFYYFSSGRSFAFLSRSKKDYLVHYVSLATVIIICLSVLPAGLYTWYAHNQEITQSVKKGQLYFAESLQKRRPDILKDVETRDSLYTPVGYYEKQQYKRGIYTIYDDTIVANTRKPGVIKNPGYEQFYFSIANDIGNNYYDPLLFPALKDSTSDGVWRWEQHGDKSLSFWFTYPDINPVDNEKTGRQFLYIGSHFPTRYVFVGFSLRGFVLLFIVAFFIIGLYRLIKSLIYKIFLRKYIITFDREPDKNKIEKYLEDFLTTHESPYPHFKDDIKNIRKEFTHFVPTADSESIYKQELEIINTINRYRIFYDYLWRSLSEKEKYMLLDFARDNLVNFKNVAEIYGLIDKGIFTEHEDEIRLFSPSFRTYLMTKKNTTEAYELRKKFQQNSTWQSFRVPLLVILLGIALFIFFTQEATSQKLTAIIAGVSSLVSLLLKFFSDGSIAAAKK